MFEWRELAPGTSTWKTIQAYAPAASGGNVLHVSFPPGQGPRQFAALAKPVGSSHSYDTYQLLTIWY
jgi:hypothetical protein